MQKTFTEVQIYRTLLILLTLLLLWQWHCKRPKPCPTIVETRKSDTTITKKPDSSAWTKPEPVAVKPGKVPARRPILKPVQGRSIPDTVWMPVDTAAILADYYAVRDYDTTYQFTDGDVRVQNTVTENGLARQKVKPVFNQVQIETTVTKAEKKRGQLYFGADAYGGRQYPIYGAGASLMYKDKKDRVYEAGPVIFKDQPIMVKAGLKFLISFRK